MKILLILKCQANIRILYTFFVRTSAIKGPIIPGIVANVFEIPKTILE